jgi:hypothetical protein
MDRVLRRTIVIAACAHAALALVAAATKEPESPPSEDAEPREAVRTTEMFVIEALDPIPTSTIEPPNASPSGGAATPTPPPRPTATATTASKPTASPLIGIVEAPAIEAIPVPSIEAPAGKEQPTNAAPFDPLAQFDPSAKKWVAPLGAGAKLDAPTSVDGKTDTKTKEEKLAAKVSKDVSALIDAKPSTGSLYAGPVVSAAHDAATSAIAPDVGVAVFVVRTDAGGAVTSVSLRDVSSDFPGWAAVGKKIEGALLAKKLVVPGGASGVQVTVKVSAKYALPSGANPKKPIDADIGGTPFGPGIAGTFDLADIGSKPLRVVAVVVLDEGRL